MECNKTSKYNSNNNGVKLLDAATEGRADDSVEILKKSSALVHIADAMGDTAFHVAARAGHGFTVSKMIEFLEEKHLEVLEEVLCEGNAYGDTPLHLALKNGHKGIVGSLARAERSAIFMMNDDLETPIDVADRAGIDLSYLFVHPEKEVSLLKRALVWFTSICENGGGADEKLSLLSLENIEWVADASSQFSDVSTRLVWSITSDNDDDEEDDCVTLYEAAKTGKEEVVKKILESELKTLEWKEPIWGGSALHVAASNGSMSTLKLIVEFMEDNNRDYLERLLLEGDNNESTPLHLALEGGHEKVARYLVEIGPSAMCKVDQEGVSPLCLAVHKGYADLVRYMTRSDLCQSIKEQLLEHAKKVSIMHDALHTRNQLDTLQAIVEGLPNLINVPDKKGWKLLSYAASKGYLDDVKYIIKCFPNSARIIDEDGSFPIHKAIARGHLSIIKEFLLCCPEALQDIDRKGRNVVELATLCQHKDIHHLLLKRKNIIWKN